MSGNLSWQVVLVASCVAASPTAFGADNLYTVYLAARQRDPAYEAARHQFDATAEKLAQARAALLPTVGLNASVGRQHGIASFNEADYDPRRMRSSAWTLQLAQSLWRPALGAVYRQAELQVRQAEHVLNQAEIDLMLRVGQIYFDMLVASENASVSDTQVNAVEQQLTLAQRNFETGLTTVTDVHEAKARLALANAQQIGALTELAAKASDLEKLLGEPPRLLARLQTDATPSAAKLGEIKDWIDSASTRHPLILSQQLAVDIAEQEVVKLGNAHGPTLEATVGYGRNAGDGSLTSPTEVASRSRSAQIGLQFNMPLYAGGGAQSRVREAIAHREKAAADLEATRRQLTAQVRQAFTAVVNGQSQIQALAEAVRASKAAVNSNKVGYRVGTRLNIDVLNAEQQQFVTERDLHKARADTIMQSLRLKAASARLGDADLQSIGNLLKAP